MTFNDLLPSGWIFEEADFSNLLTKGVVSISHTSKGITLSGVGYSFEEALVSALTKIPKATHSQVSIEKYVTQHIEGVKLNSVMPKGWRLYQAFLSPTNYYTNDGVFEVSVSLGQLNPFVENVWKSFAGSNNPNIFTVVADTFDEALFKAIMGVA